MTASIRLAEPRDCPDLADLCTQLGYPSTEQQVAARLAHILEYTDHAVFVAEVAGRVSGWVHVHVSPNLEVDRMGEVGGLVVSADLRGQGVGKALMARAEAWAAQHGCREVWLRSNIVRTDAHRFYQALGYQIIKTSHTFRKQI